MTLQWGGGSVICSEQPEVCMCTLKWVGVCFHAVGVSVKVTEPQGMCSCPLQRGVLQLHRLYFGLHLSCFIPRLFFPHLLCSHLLGENFFPCTFFFFSFFLRMNKRRQVESDREVCFLCSPPPTRSLSSILSLPSQRNRDFSFPATLILRGTVEEEEYFLSSQELKDHQESKEETVRASKRTFEQ